MIDIIESSICSSKAKGYDWILQSFIYARKKKIASRVVLKYEVRCIARSYFSPETQNNKSFYLGLNTYNEGDEKLKPHRSNIFYTLRAKE